MRLFILAFYFTGGFDGWACNTGVSLIQGLGKSITLLSPA
jgi:hypothetical protein